MPRKSQTNDSQNVADRLSDAVGVSRKANKSHDKNDGGEAYDEETDDEQANEQLQSTTTDTDLAADYSKIEQHKQDRKKKRKQFIEHFGKRGDDRRSGLRIKEDGAYEWSAMDYKHDEGVTVFRFDRTGENIQRQKKNIPLEKLVQLNPDPTEHSRLRELQTGASEQGNEDASENKEHDTTESKSQQNKEMQHKQQQSSNSDNAREDTQTQIDAIAQEVGLNDDSQDKLQEMIANAPHEYSEEMIRNAAAGLLEHQQATAEETQQKTATQAESEKKEETKKEAQQDTTRAKRAVEQIAKKDGPISEDEAQKIQAADTEQMQEHYKEAREKNPDDTPAEKTSSSFGIAERVSASKKTEEAKKSQSKKESETISIQQQFFAVGKQVLMYIRDLYKAKDELSDADKQKVSAINEEITAYEKYHTQLENNNAIDEDEIRQRVVGLNKAANAHPRLREQQPELVAQLKDAEQSLDINI